MDAALRPKETGQPMTTRIDLHNHSFYSEDSCADPEESIERAISLGLNGIAFTEHNSFEASEPIELVKRKFEGMIMVFRGAEYTAMEGHVLVFGIKRDILDLVGPHAPIKEFIKAANEEGGVAVIPHPFREWSLLKADIKTLEGVAAIEAYNGHNNELENLRALDAAHRLFLPTTGGSDSHSVNEIGGCFTEFDEKVDYGNFIDALKRGRYRGVCTE